MPRKRFCSTVWGGAAWLAVSSGDQQRLAWLLTTSSQQRRTARSAMPSSRGGLAAAAACWLAAAASVQGGDGAPPKNNNLLMIISDQHRWDCLSEAGNPTIRTPNLDQLAKDGAHFTAAYTVCPVCCPSRTSMLAGQTPEQTQVRGNAEMSTGPRVMTYDRALLANGWAGEYHGKYHSPYNYTRDDNLTSYYSRPVRWLNGGGPISPPAGVQSLSTAYRAYLDEHEPLKQLQRGQLLDAMYRRPYWADVADLRYNQTFNGTLLALSNRLISEGHANEIPTTDQQHVNGRLALQPNHSYSALTLMDGMAALERLKDAPFTLTVSFEAPHPPFIITLPFYGMYDNGSLPDPVTVEDPMTASPYHHPHSPSGDEAQVRQQRSNYYGMIAQNDKLVGDLLAKLEQLALTSRTLVVYIADHGEMLGDHHMQSKMVFYEGSVHIPLIMRLPGVIPAGRVVDEPVSNMALFGTIVDYLGLPGDLAPPTSKSLRPLIEGVDTDSNTERVIFSFWDSDISPVSPAAELTDRAPCNPPLLASTSYMQIRSSRDLIVFSEEESKEKSLPTHVTHPRRIPRRASWHLTVASSL